jgi:hypothetical protein
MKVISASLFALMLMSPLARGDEWKRWPAQADELAASIGFPPGFTSIRARQPAPAGTVGHEPLLAAHFRSADRKVEFAVTVYYVRMWSQAPKARRITAVVAPGEKVIERKTSRKKFTGEHGEYWGYDEEMTVAGNGYTRYLLNSFSTSTLPGASSELWEFRTTDDESRKRYAAVYKKFKDSLNIGED